MTSPYIPNGPFCASARIAKIMSRCCRTSSTGTSISALTPRIPIVPFRLASQPGAAIVNCQGSLSVIDGGATSFGVYGSDPAKRSGAERTAAAPAKKNHFSLMEHDFIVVDAEIREKKLVINQSS